MMELRGIEAYNGAQAYKKETGKKTVEREFESILTGEPEHPQVVNIADSKENKNENELFTISSAAETVTYNFFGKVSRYYKHSGINVDISA